MRCKLPRRAILVLSFCHRKDAASGTRRSALRQLHAQGSLVCEAMSSRHRARRAARALVESNTCCLGRAPSFGQLRRTRTRHAYASPLASVLQAARSGRPRADGEKSRPARHRRLRRRNAVIPTSFRLVAGGYSATTRTIAAWSMMVTVDGVPTPLSPDDI